MRATKKSSESNTINICEITTQRFICNLVGTSPILLHCLLAKSPPGLELLVGGETKNKAEKKSTIKHDVYKEFRASPHVFEGNDAPTRLAVTGPMVKGALKSAALDIPGAAKTEIGRLAWVQGHLLSLYGVPQIHMTMVRNSGMNRSPDVRTRCIVRNWCCTIEVTHVVPILPQSSVVNLLMAAGLMRGLGDWRPEKGSGTFGQFRVTDMKDKEFQQIVKTGGRVAQDKAMASPTPYDKDTGELLSRYREEVRRRGFKVEGDL